MQRNQLCLTWLGLRHQFDGGRLQFFKKIIEMSNMFFALGANLNMCLGSIITFPLSKLFSSLVFFAASDCRFISFSISTASAVLSTITPLSLLPPPLSKIFVRTDGASFSLHKISSPCAAGCLAESTQPETNTIERGAPEEQEKADRGGRPTTLEVCVHEAFQRCRAIFTWAAAIVVALAGRGQSKHEEHYMCWPFVEGWSWCSPIS